MRPNCSSIPSRVTNRQPGLPIEVWVGTRCPEAVAGVAVCRPNVNRQIVQNAFRGRGGIRIHSIGPADVVDGIRSASGKLSILARDGCQASAKP